MIIEERWYQEGAVESLFDTFEQHKGLDLQGNIIRCNPLVAMPTGTGKSLVIAKFLYRAMTMFPGTRVMKLTHVKELISQNAKKLLEVWPTAPIGIHSAGLGDRQFVQPIIFGGVKSVVKNIEQFGRRDLLVIDEAHLVSDKDDTTYLEVIQRLLEINPYMRVIGLTATGYRQGLGLLTNGPIFTHFCYDITGIEAFNRLIAEGYLCPLVPKPTANKIDISGVGISGGEYNQKQLQAAVDKPDIMYRALLEAVPQGADRASWLCFAAGIENAEHICQMLNEVFGIPSVVIHSKQSDKVNADNLELWQTGQVRCAVNMNSLTTGVDHPACDYIIDMQPTMSTGKHVQKYGRGTRPFDWYKLTPAQQQRLRYFEGYVKPNCKVMDFAGNVPRLGPINDPVIPKPRGSGPPGDAPVRICPACGTYNHASVRTCFICGHEFEFELGIGANAGTAELLASDMPEIEYFNVIKAVYAPHVSLKTGNNTIKVSYYCEGLRTFYEYVTVEAKGYAGKQGRDWFRQRFASEPPLTNAEVLQFSSLLRTPRQISVWVNTKYPRVLKAEF